MRGTSSADLQYVLESLGVHVTHATHREITAFCPVHEKYLGRPNVNTPAFSMNAETGAWLCFSCGAKGSLIGLMIELGAGLNDVADVEKTIVKAKLSHKDEPKVAADPDEYEVDEYDYEQFEEVPRKMAEARRLDRDLLWDFGVRYNPANRAWVIPVRTAHGVLLGWQEKKPGWFRNRPKGIPKSMTLFGLDQFDSDTAILVESPLDVVRMATVGIEGGLASYGVFVSTEQFRLIAGHADRLIVALDNDSAGIAECRKLRKNGFPQPTGGVKWFAYDGDDYKDPGDMPARLIKEGVRNASIIPWWRHRAA